MRDVTPGAIAGVVRSVVMGFAVPEFPAQLMLTARSLPTNTG